MQTENIYYQNRKKKICIILHGFSNGGIEKVLYTYLTRLDLKNVQIDFVCFESQSKECFSAFKNISNNIFFVSPIRKNIIKHILEIKTIIRKGNYDIVHSNLGMWNSISLYYAKKFNVHIRISHCHIAMPDNIVKKLVKHLNSFIIKKCATRLVGCSSIACQYLYGKHANVEILPNCIDFSYYSYKEVNKKEFLLANKLPVDTILIGNIGRLSVQKNHKHMLDIAKIFKAKKVNACFVCVGCGELKSYLIREIKKCNLSKNFLLVGETNDTAWFYSLFDIYCFPSLYEGLGMSFVEAEVSGLPCLISNKIPTEAIISSRVMVLDLKISPKVWSEEILKLYYDNMGCDRFNMNKYLLANASIFDLNNNIKKIKKIYNME